MTQVNADQIAAVRRFSRFYTRRIGVLHEGLLQSRFSLTEARVLYELASRTALTASDVAAELDLDPGYLSRILQKFEQDGLLARTSSATDRRQSMLSLTAAGHEAFAPLDARSKAEIAALLAPLPAPAWAELATCLQRVETLLGESPPDWHLRPPQPGDIGWAVERHGTLYAAEYGFDSRFEALVARIAGDFLAAHDPTAERCWIAERAGVRLGCIFLVRHAPEVGKLRLLLVEPAARGVGLGRALVHTCIDEARQAGYRQLMLWTNDILVAARGIYAGSGFRLVERTPHADFGPQIVGETWVLDLR